MVSGGGKRIKDQRRGDASDAHSAYPSSRLLVWHSRFDHVRSRHASIVRGHALNQQIELVLPTSAAVDIAEAIKWETSFYYEVTASLAMLLSPRFISEYVLHGSVYMIAKNVAIDSQNSAMLLPSGELLLLVDNETYEQLGLVGSKYAQQIPAEAQSAKQHRMRRGRRHVVTIDLTSEVFASPAVDDASKSNTRRDRVLHCLATKFQPIEMLICAYTERGAPRTVMFGDDDTIERMRVEVNGSFERLQDVFVPALHQFYGEAKKESHVEEPMDMALLRGSLEAVYDWLGVVAARLTDLLQQKPLEEYVSTFHGALADGIPMEEHSELSVIRWRGLIASAFVTRVMDRARDSVNSGKLPWAAVTVWGMPDAIVSWQQEYDTKPPRHHKTKNTKKEQDATTAAARGGGRQGDGKDEKAPPPEVVNREHGYLVHGSNNCTFVVLPEKEYFVVQELGPHDGTM